MLLVHLAALLLLSLPPAAGTGSFRGAVVAPRRLGPPGCADVGQKALACDATQGREECCPDLVCNGDRCAAPSVGGPTDPPTNPPTQPPSAAPTKSPTESPGGPESTPSPTQSPSQPPTRSPTRSPVEASACSPGLLCECDGSPGANCATDDECGQAQSVRKCNKDPLDDPDNVCQGDADCSGKGNKCRSYTVVVPGTCLAVGSRPPSASPTKSPTNNPTESPHPTLTLKPTGEGVAYPVASAEEIIDAMSNATAGDTLLMSTSSPWTDQDIIFRGTGTADAPITLTTDTPGTPVLLTGSSKLRISGSYLVVDGLSFSSGGLTNNERVIEFRTSSSELADHCRLTNSAIIEYNPTDGNADTRWVNLHGTNNAVDHCYFSGKNHLGALLIVWRPDDTLDNHVIENNYFGDFASGGGDNGWETIRIGTSTTSLSDSSTVVSNNLFERCDGEIEIISVKSGNNLLRGNTFDSCQGMLTLRHGRGNTVDGNFFLGRGVPNSGGVRIIDSDHVVTNNYFKGLTGSSARAAVVLANGLENSALNGYFPVDRATVAFNTIYECEEAFRIGWRSSSNAVKVKDSAIANNAVFATTGTTIINEEDAPDNMAYEGNLMYGEGVPLGIDPVPSGVTQTDPGLALGASDGLYRPGSGSLCIDGAAGSYPFVATDMDGQPRADPKDVGADEVSSDAVTSRPLSAADVGGAIGPSWW